VQDSLSRAHLEACKSARSQVGRCFDLCAYRFEKNRVVRHQTNFPQHITDSGAAYRIQATTPLKPEIRDQVGSHLPSELRLAMTGK
jgi:hypothetical protein